jgi:hypothetical protein
MPRERTEREAAYFALLRARDELTILSRYEEYLHAEAQRLRRQASEGAALAAGVSDAARRVMRASDTDLAEVVERRLRLIDDELSRLPERLAAAANYVEECERTASLLGGGG